MCFSRVKLFLINSLSKLLFGKWSNILNRTIQSIFVSRPDILYRTIKIRDAQIITYPFPERFRSFFIRTHSFPERFLFELKNVTIIRENGAIVTSDEMILQESIGSLRRLLRRGDIRHSLTKKPERPGSDQPFYFAPLKPFYHFLLEEIPSLLYALSKIENLSILIDDRGNDVRYYHDAFKLLFGAEFHHKINFIGKNVTVNRCVLTQRHTSTGKIHPDEIRLLNDHFLPKVKTGKSPERIYISRRKAIHRPIENEPEIEFFLRQQRFTVLNLEDYSLEQQIAIIKNSRVIIAPHGAGLSHIIWNPAVKKTILEIFPSYLTNDCFASIAFLLNYNYDYIICSQYRNREICNLELLREKLT